MFSFKRMMTVARKETIEMFRDPVRVVANFAVPIVLMFLFSSGMNMDIKNIPFVVLDFDNTPASREYADAYINSEYYLYRGHVYSNKEAEVALQKNVARFYVDIPAGFGRNLSAGKGTQVGTFIDGTQPFRAESIKGYTSGTNSTYLLNKATEEYGLTGNLTNFSIKSRYWYNQASESKYTFVPGAIAVILIAIPAIMMTLSIVKEKEIGTITNFYATPLTKLEFLIGKQSIYIAIFFVIYFMLVGIAVFIYGVPLKGSFLLLTGMSLVYIFCTTAIGLLVSSFVKSQIAGLLIALITTMIPSFTYSGLLTPISSLDASGQMTARLYPVIYYMRTVMGTFTKDLPIKTMLPNFAYLTIFYIAVMVLCNILLKKQEK